MPITTKRAAVALAAALSWGGAGCEQPVSAPHDVVDDGAAGVGDPAALVPFTGRTTRGDIATRNLSAQIDAAERALAAMPDDASRHGRLVDLLLARVQFFGTFADLDRALNVAHAAVTRTGGGDAETFLLRARARGAVHRFDEAMLDLDAAQAAGAETEAARATVRLARGEDVAEVLRAREEAARRAPGFETSVGLAAALAAVGRFDEADRAYAGALEGYRDASPLPVAWVQFRRGVMWAEQAGVRARAVPLYRDAVARLPGYVAANVHLAEIEAVTGAHAVAVARLRERVDATDDPEPLGRLAQLLAQDDPAGAARYAARAREAWEALLARHREAFLDHASEFFMGAGDDAARALDLALENLRARRDDRAFLLALGAARAAARPDVACVVAAEAREGRGNVLLRALLDEVRAGCPR